MVVAASVPSTLASFRHRWEFGVPLYGARFPFTRSTLPTSPLIHQRVVGRLTPAALIAFFVPGGPRRCVEGRGRRCCSLRSFLPTGVAIAVAVAGEASPQTGIELVYAGAFGALRRATPAGAERGQERRCLGQRVRAVPIS